MTRESRADELRAKAQRDLRAREESFRRSDTDGFLPQWALGLSSRKASLQADIEDAGGLARFLGLYEGNRRVKARIIETEYGRCWLIHEDEAELRTARGKPFVPLAGHRTSRVQQKLGLTERWEMAPAEAVYEGKGRGLSGTAWVAARRTGDPWGLDSVPTTPEGD